MAHIIALQGPGDSGKNRTLIQALKDLHVMHPSATAQALHDAKNGMKIVLRGVHGRIIGIESQGDPRSRLQQSLSDLLSAKCDVIFCVRLILERPLVELVSTCLRTRFNSSSRSALPAFTRIATQQQLLHSLSWPGCRPGQSLKTDGYAAA